MTKGQRKALEWFVTQGEIALFDNTAPPRVVRQHLLKLGWIESCGTTPGRMPFLKYRINDEGRAALAREQA